MKYSAGLLLASAMMPMALAFNWRVGVGKDETTGRKGMGFDPSVINPIAGDTIEFEFRSGVHSVVQSTFDNPCVDDGGFNSGVQTVPDNLDVDAPGLPIVRLIVNDTSPLWFFDEAGGLCHQGAVLSVNPTQAQTPAVFKANAAQPPKPRTASSASTNTPGSTGTSANDAAQSSPASGGSSGSGAPANSATGASTQHIMGSLLCASAAALVLSVSGLTF